MTKTSHWMLAAMATTGVAWLGVACAPTSEPEPETSATVAAEPAPRTGGRPIWTPCVKEQGDCISGARVEVKQDQDERCQVDLRPWFTGSPRRIDVYSEGRVFFLVVWQEGCQGCDVHIKDHGGESPWDGTCHDDTWRPRPNEDFQLAPCKVKEDDDGADYDFDLELVPGADCGAERTGGTVRVRGSGKPPQGDTPAR